MDIREREFSTKTNSPPLQDLVDILDQIVLEEIDIIQENNQVDLWTINVTHYVTAVTLLEKEGKLREVNTRINKKEKQGWQIRSESHIATIR